MHDDEAAFAELVTRHRPEIQLHCYRMLGSFHEAEDLAQETFLRAWRYRADYRGPGTYRAWLYSIATRACLDVLKRHRRRQVRTSLPDPSPEATTSYLAPTPPVAVPWLQPYPDHLLDEVVDRNAESGASPASTVVARETVELAFLAAVQHLPARQRAVLILRDVLDWSARETASALGTSVPAVNSALQRARPAVRQHLPSRRLDWTAPANSSAGDRELVRRYIDAIERSDATALAELLVADARSSHQAGAGGHTGTEPAWYQGRGTLVAAWAPVMEGPAGGPSLRMLPVRANRQPAVATYLRLPCQPDYMPFALAVLSLANDRIAEVMAFRPEVFDAFGLPPRLGNDES
ncbi:RNA polymerase subunit sigma-70 [Jiangella gansuensis]|uniref:RNA polymerase subunit sigma-70 n=1 Tax=Jiangella gansuensis TaxID=281473 RepID=UPI00047C0A74|nr:RNA polymerase subunit sigma-70 [Jiangella gansuensis]